MLKNICLFGLILLLSGCALRNEYHDLKLKQDENQIVKTHPKLAIAFGGGGVRGFTHLGVIKALEENHIKADIVTGSSAGSIAAVLYASGMSYDEIKNKIDSLGMFDIADIVISNKGFVNGKKLATWINEAVSKKDLKSMPIQVGITATDMTQRKSVLIIDGNPGEAVQTSSSIPGFFVPVENNESLLVDGGILNVVPIKYARDLGADVVVGVDIYCSNQPKTKQGIVKMLLGTVRMLSCKLAEDELKNADILIESDFEPENMASFEDKDKQIEIGYKKTMALMPQIKKLFRRENGK